jgi:hypothetical protein
MMSTLFYELRWVVFLIRCILYLAYGLLETVSKRGSRLVFPAITLAVSVYDRHAMENEIAWCLRQVNWQHMPVSLGMMLMLVFALAVGMCLLLFFAFGMLRIAVLGVLALVAVHYYQWPPGYDIAAYLDFRDVMLAAMFVVAVCAYVAFSLILSLVLGIFPPIVRPLKPLRRLTAQNRPIRPVVVRIAVPKLPRPRPPRRVETLQPEA